jgi:hypothetical protein
MEDHVVTDTVYIATEDIVWEALWDQARKLKKKEIEELEREYTKKKVVASTDSHMLNVLRENYMQPLNSELGQTIVNTKWAELLYHTNRYMQRGSLMENYAIRKLQEQIICQVQLSCCIRIRRFSGVKNRYLFYPRVYVVYRRVYILLCCSWESAFSQLVSQYSIGLIFDQTRSDRIRHVHTRSNLI